MATKTPSKTSARSRARTRKPRAKAAARAAAFSASTQSRLSDLPKMAKAMTPKQAFELYKANAKMALDVINAAIENTAKLRKLQFEGEEEARSMQKKALRRQAIRIS
jgi:hypothetical protein